MGTFDGIQIGSTGLHAQRRGVETAGQNIANVNTAGYTRQRVEMTADSGPVVPAIHSLWDGGGLGVREAEVARLRDAFIDRRAREEGSLLAELEVGANTLRGIEQVLKEPSDDGLSAVLADFLAAWDDLGNSPDDIGARTQVIERGVTLMSDLDQIQRSLIALRETNATVVDTITSKVNTAAAQVASIQDSIKSARAAGLNAHELEDQRDLLLEQITSQIGGTVRYEDDGTATLFVGGAALVRGSKSYEIEVVDTAGQLSLQWTTSGQPVGTGGQVKGVLEAVNTVIPNYMTAMDGVATQVMTEVNAVHTSGFDRNGDPGLDFFVVGPTGMRVNPAIVGDPNKVAAAATPGTLDGSIAQKMAAIDGIDKAYRETVVRLGVSSQSSQRRVQLQNSLVEQVRFEQESANGVNLDEELSDLVRFQRAYEASSRFVSVIDEMLNTLVNGTGVVGR